MMRRASSQLANEDGTQVTDASKVYTLLIRGRCMSRKD